jgi:flagellin
LGISISGIGTYGSLSGLQSAQENLSADESKLATGSTVSAENDPAGLSIDQMMRAQNSGLQIASANAQSGISMLQTAGGALGQTSGILQQIRTLAVQAGNGTEDASSLAAIGNQVSQSLAQIDSIASSTSFNGTNLLDGSTSSLSFQTGADGSSSDSTSVNLPNAGVSALGLSGIAATIAGGGDMSSVLNAIDAASSTVSSAQSNIGSTTNALTDTVNNLSSAITSGASSMSGIGDTDMAQASMKMSSDKIKSEFSMSLLAQANSLNQQSALALLKTA